MSNKEKTAIALQPGNRFRFSGDDQVCTCISIEVIDGKTVVLYDDYTGQRKKTIIESLLELERI